MTKYNLYKLQNETLDAAIIITYILYILLALGVYFVKPQYINILHDTVKVYVCLFLIYRFNPFIHNIKCNNLDKRIAFISGFFLLSTTILNQIFTYFLSKTKNDFESIKKKRDIYIQNLRNKYTTSLQ